MAHREPPVRAEAAELFRTGAHFNVCGDGRFMALAVRETCARIYREAVGASADDAERWMDQVERNTGRYVADVFA